MLTTLHADSKVHVCTTIAPVHQSQHAFPSHKSMRNRCLHHGWQVRAQQPCDHHRYWRHWPMAQSLVANAADCFCGGSANLALASQPCHGTAPARRVRARNLDGEARLVDHDERTPKLEGCAARASAALAATLRKKRKPPSRERSNGEKMAPRQRVDSPRQRVAKMRRWDFGLVLSQGVFSAAILVYSTILFNT